MHMPIGKETITNEIVKLLSQVVSVDDIDINMYLSEKGEIRMDSLKFLKFLTLLEKKYNINIDDEYWDYTKLSTIHKITDYVSLKLSDSSNAN